jgi:hypothetical protein
MGIKAQVQGYVQKLLPPSLSDNRDQASSIRLKRYGEMHVSEFDTSLNGYCEEGSFCVATTPTPGTGLTWGFSASWQTAADTAPHIFISNNETGNGKTIYLAWIKLIVTAGTTATTSIQFAGVLDLYSRSITTDNTSTLTTVNTNGNVPNIPATLIKVQNSATPSVIAARSPQARTVCRGVLGGFPVAGDELVMLFGRGNQHGHAGLTAVEAAAPRKSVSNCPPVTIAPGQNFTVNVWFPAITTSAINPEVEIAYWAR